MENRDAAWYYPQLGEATALPRADRGLSSQPAGEGELLCALHEAEVAGGGVEALRRWGSLRQRTGAGRRPRPTPSSLHGSPLNHAGVGSAPGHGWHSDETAVRIARSQHWLWRAVDEHGATLDVLLQEQRDTDAAERFFERLLSHAGVAPERINTDKLGSYAAAIGRTPERSGVDHQQVRSTVCCDNRVEQAHQPTRGRERRMGWFRCPIFSAALPERIHPYVEPLPSTSPLFHRLRVPGCTSGTLRGLAGRSRAAPVIGLGRILSPPVRPPLRPASSSSRSHSSSVPHSYAPDSAFPGRTR